MQASDKHKQSLGKRTRYYQSVLDGNSLHKGMLYSDLRPTYIIFICTFDPFGKKFAKYTFKTLCEQDTTLAINDSSLKIILNTTGDKHKLNKDLQILLEYIDTGVAQDDFTMALASEVNRLHNDPKVEANYMTIEQHEMELKADAKAEGENKMAQLMSLLFKEKRYEDAEKAAADPVYRSQLLQKYLPEN